MSVSGSDPIGGEIKLVKEGGKTVVNKTEVSAVHTVVERSGLGRKEVGQSTEMKGELCSGDRNDLLCGADLMMRRKEGRKSR